VLGAEWVLGAKWILGSACGQGAVACWAAAMPFGKKAAEGAPQTVDHTGPAQPGLWSVDSLGPGSPRASGAAALWALY
jgi:hypothetical protein